MNKDEAQNLLPWYAVGALDPDEARAVEAHLEGSAELMQELAELRVLHNSVKEVADNEPVFRPTLINEALQRIDEYEATRPQENRSTSGSVVNWLRHTLVGGWMTSPLGARVAMVAQFAMILVLGGALLMPMAQGPGGTGAVYETSSGPNAGPNDGGTAVTVYFEPDAQERNISELMIDIDALIVDGPSGQGAYTIRLRPIEGDAVTDQARLEQLRRADIVRFANKAE